MYVGQVSTLNPSIRSIGTETKANGGSSQTSSAKRVPGRRTPRRPRPPPQLGPLQLGPRQPQPRCLLLLLLPCRSQPSRHRLRPTWLPAAKQTCLLLMVGMRGSGGGCVRWRPSSCAWSSGNVRKERTYIRSRHRSAYRLQPERLGPPKPDDPGGGVERGIGCVSELTPIVWVFSRVPGARSSRSMAAGLRPGPFTIHTTGTHLGRWAGRLRLRPPIDRQQTNANNNKGRGCKNGHRHAGTRPRPGDGMRGPNRARGGATRCRRHWLSIDRRPAGIDGSVWVEIASGPAVVGGPKQHHRPQQHHRLSRSME